MTEIRIGADIGGTFTDLVAVRADGRFRTKKVSSTVDDYARAIDEGVAALLAELGEAPSAVGQLAHGTTVASNAILEGKGARTGLIATKGFRDVLEIRTLRMPRLYDMAWQKPPALVPRHLRREVDERLDASGVVERALDAEEAERVVAELLAEGVEAISICLLHAYANPVHEEALRDIVARLAPDLPVSVGHEVLPEINEYNRVSTTVVNAYVKPPVASYLERLGGRLARSGLGAPILLMQSNGGLTSAERAARFPMNIVESGPAAGVTGAQAIAAASGLSRIITFDMGGTTAKAALVEDGQAAQAGEYQVGGGIIAGSRLLTGGGYMLKVPAIDLAEVGAGGGSLIWRDAGGSLRIGPESAGATPGPVCYGRGGEEPTVTDANVVLGYLSPTGLADGSVPLDRSLALEVLERKIARPLGLPVEEAAFGAHRIAAANMMQAIRAVSVERGRDPRGFALFAFGGNGPLFAAGMARALGIREIVVPPSPGVFSAVGLLHADLEHHVQRSLRAPLGRLEPAAVERMLREMEAQALAVLADEGCGRERVRLTRYARLQYQGQSFDLRIPFGDGAVRAESLAQLDAAFGAEHERTYGHRAGTAEPVEIVGIEVVAHARREGAAPTRPDPAGHPVPSGPAAREAFFGPDLGWLETPVLRRHALAGRRSGPLIVEEYDATCLVPPGWQASRDAFGNIRIDMEKPD
ncbi:hydantoinase/oxoprolinase family protein [Faunimonas sp. B44]|uniref:hydantoinase/oxoprolinase family protein n=1 Tax=Faunimonas sp. B44 TaxID=3461493 RepID=UPI004044EEA4